MDRAWYREYFNKYYLDRKSEYISLLGGKCVKCGSTKNLEFDHINPPDKKFNITNFLSFSKAQVLEEIKKCQLLCKTCHKVKTYKVVEHGTTTMYRHGCRCETCSQSNTENMRRWRVKRSGGRKAIAAVLKTDDG